jgi:predicted MFS family arabinose efflux permease
MKDSCRVRQALRRSIWDGVFANLYAGLTGGIFLAGYALALHASEVQIGLLASLPLIANLAQPFSTYAISRLGRRRPLALVSAAAARLSWLGLIGASVYMGASPELLLLSLGLVTISQIGTAVNNLVWMSWMADLVREELRGRYFGSRNAALGAATLVATLAGGYALDVWKESHPGGELHALRGLFLIGVACGLVSLLIQARIHEPRLQEADAPQPLRQRFLQPFQDTNFHRFLVFTLVWNFGVYCAAPFFAVYMLKTLELSYTTVAAYATISSLANLLSVRLWGCVADRATNKTVLLLAGVLVAGVPVGWMWTSPQTWLLIAVLHVQGGLC